MLPDSEYNGMQSEKIEAAQVWIEIVQCSSESFWYRDLVGQKMAVTDITVRDYYVMHKGMLKGVLWKDAAIIEKSS